MLLLLSSSTTRRQCSWNIMRIFHSVSLRIGKGDVNKCNPMEIKDDPVVKAQ
jgi:hypothetical protein